MDVPRESEPAAVAARLAATAADRGRAGALALIAQHAAGLSAAARQEVLRFKAEGFDADEVAGAEARQANVDDWAGRAERELERSRLKAPKPQPGVFTVWGRVLREDGSPVGGCVVRAFTDRQDAGEGLAATRTDAAGLFVLPIPMAGAQGDPKERPQGAAAAAAGGGVAPFEVIRLQFTLRKNDDAAPDEGSPALPAQGGMLAYVEWVLPPDDGGPPPPRPRPPAASKAAAAGKRRAAGGAKKRRG
jgi:hypothetical protein